ncbi:hypothetical protein ACOME3_009329 [Neoechinorhynchus agilis]
MTATTKPSIKVPSEMPANATALDMPPAQPMSWEEARSLTFYFNDDLVNDPMDAFIYDGRKFVKLPQEDYGVFYMKDSYIYIARYWKRANNERVDEGEDQGGFSDEENEFCERSCSKEEANVASNDVMPKSETEQVVYFWQGREAGNTAWFFFNFQLKKRFEETLATCFKVVKFDQQRENIKFLAHFRQRIIIKRGSFFDTENKDNSESIYELRWSYSPICTRCIELPRDEVKIALLNSYCYILKFGDKNEPYLWFGEKVNEDDILCARNIARFLSNGNKYHELTDLSEISTLIHSSNKEILVDKVFDFKTVGFTDKSRLFKCSNEKGHFAVSEKWPDFCQDDLEQDDVMILDTGTSIVIWVGQQASEAELKQAFKAAQSYYGHLTRTNSGPKRRIRFCATGKEDEEFTRCFHGWTHKKA